jgi:hypothetical protein
MRAAPAREDRGHKLQFFAALLLIASAAADAVEEPFFEAHGEATYIRQYKPGFPADYSGANSLRPQREYDYTFTSTLFFGARLGATELYFNPELVSGIPLSDLHGLN